MTEDAITPDLSYINPGLRSLAVPLAELVPDPANARTHDEANLAAIRGSLRKFGQRAPLVVQQQGMIVRAGNGRLEAARQLGWTHVAAIIVDEDDIDAVTFAIADNRTAELAAWDTTALDRLLRTINVGDEDLQQMLGDLASDTGLVPPEEEEQDASPAADLRDTWQILVTCRDESEQLALLEQLTTDGHECRALVG